MSPVLDETTTESTVSPVQRLRTTMAGVRLSISWLGVRKTLTPDQKAQAADTFVAEGAYMSAAKKLLDRIVEGRMGKFLSEVALVEQPFVKDADRTVGELELAASERAIIARRSARSTDDSESDCLAGC